MLEWAQRGETRLGVQTKRWTRAEYESLLRHGVLDEDDRVQLIRGEIVEMAPQGAAHAAAISLAAGVLHSTFSPSHHIRVQLPLALSADSEPEPDLAVVSGSPRDYAQSHPATAALVVEVADTTGEFDRSRKGPMYAGANIPEFWVVDVNARAVDVYRDPESDPAARARYRTHQRVEAGGTVAPLSSPSSPLPVNELLA